MTTLMILMMRMLKMTNEEIWKPIKGYELLYEVSNFGRVKSLRKTNNQYSEHVTHGSSDGKHGYLKVKLKNETGNKTFQVHRLVAEAFIHNPDNFPQVNHKDENKKNNCVDNLEWCNQQYNNEYSHNKKICQFFGGEKIAEYKSISYASQITKISRTSINNALTGWSETAGGYEWKYCD